MRTLLPWRWRTKPQPRSRAAIEPVPTPTIVSHDWTIGWKVANIYIRQDGALCFAPVHQDGAIRAYGVDAVAECQRYAHPAPYDTCKCGFNAWEDLEIVWRYARGAQRAKEYGIAQTESLVLLRVGLYGDVVDGTITIGPDWKPWGYRASQQRVADIFFSKECASCSQPAVGLGALDYNITWAGWRLRPLCQEHLDQTERTVKTDRLMARNDVTVHWGYPSE